MSSTEPRLSRRRFLLGGAAASTMAAASAAGYSVGLSSADTSEDYATGRDVVSPFGGHQAGIATPPQAKAVFIALDVRPETRRTDLRRWMRVLSEDISRLTLGDAALADPQPELALLPARLTVTVGFGPGIFEVPGLSTHRPPWLRPLPRFTNDQLEEAWTGGDVLLQVCSDDAITLSHAQRMLLKDSAAFASLRWIQPGFQRARGSEPAGTTPRNLMGQVDGTANPTPGSTDFDSAVWSTGPPAWMTGGTGLVVRRIRMDLDPWNAMSREQKEQVMGRRLADGSPLTGSAEHDKPDLSATDSRGLPVIPPFAHIRIAAASSPGERMLRRGYNYDGLLPGGEPDVGLVFVAAVADPTTQFVPVQRRLDESDALNRWTTAVGSAVFAVPPGFRRGGYLAEGLLG